MTKKKTGDLVNVGTRESPLWIDRAMVEGNSYKGLRWWEIGYTITVVLGELIVQHLYGFSIKERNESEKSKKSK